MFGLLSKIGDAVAPPSDDNLPAREVDAEGYVDECPEGLRALRRVPPQHVKGPPDARLEALALALPPPPEAAGSYNPVVVCGDMIFVSGQLPFKEDGTLHKGKVVDVIVDGENQVGEEDGVKAARACALTTIALLKKQLGTLDVIKRCVKVNGYVNCADDFEAHAKVLNGYTEMMVEVFGEAGRPARAAVGVSSLPFNISVEVEAMFQLKM